MTAATVKPASPSPVCGAVRGAYRCWTIYLGGVRITSRSRVKPIKGPALSGGRVLPPLSMLEADYRKSKRGSIAQRRAGVRLRLARRVLKHNGELS